MDPSLSREHLDKLLADEARALTRLEALLDQEHALLTANDIDGFERIGVERQNCVGELVRIEDERRSLCRLFNVAADAAGLEKLMKWCDPSLRLQSRWAECASRAGRCKDRNDRNGALVTARLKRVEGMLDVLTGRAAQPKVYGPQGAYQSPGRSTHVLATV